MRNKTQGLLILGLYAITILGFALMIAMKVA